MDKLLLLVLVPWGGVGGRGGGWGLVGRTAEQLVAVVMGVGWVGHIEWEIPIQINFSINFVQFTCISHNTGEAYC